MKGQIIVHILWFIGAVLMYIEYCYFWQLKWYRLDRFRDFLSTKKGKYAVYNTYTLARMVISITIFIFTPINYRVIHYTIAAIFLSDICYVLWQKYKKLYRRPIFSVKALIIIVGSVAVEYIVYMLTRDWVFVLFVSALRVYILSLNVIIINWSTNQIKRIYFKRAETKLQKYPKLIKIGITGSYGKTSVKELLTQLLSNFYRVSSTPKNTNSDIGISKYILETDFSHTDVCIVEMGAYNKGDIKLVCDIVHPTIGILTAINHQHLSLFGSIENIQTTKYELLRSIPDTGTSITNADNRLCMQYIHDLRSNVLTFGVEAENHPNCLIEKVQHKEDGLSIEYALMIEGTKKEIKTHPMVIGEHQATNIAPCILVAKTLGVEDEKIVEAVNKLTQPEQSIKIYKIKNAVVIDDSYNSNPDGFKAALELLGTFSSDKRRIVITRGMHELGEESNELHERIGNEISFFADEVVITTPDFAEAIKKGILSKYQSVVIEKFETDALVEYVKKLLEEDVVLLIENRVPTSVRKLYMSTL